MEMKKENKIILKQWAKMFLVIFVLVLMASSIYLITKGFIPGESKKEPLVTYNYNSNIDYKVYLKDNSYFQSKYLGMDTQYITALIDYIEFTPRYTLKSDKKMNYSYNYQIVATAQGTHDGEDGKVVEVWSKSYPILNSVSKTANSDTFTINETVKVDYNKYNSILLDFRKEFGISVNASVDVALKVNVNATSKDDNNIAFNTDADMVLQIPLLNATTKFTTKYSPEGSKTIYKETKTDSTVDFKNIILGSILLLISLYLTFKTVRGLLVATQKSEYVITYNKILKNYSDIIAEAENMPDLSKYDVIIINNFEDLVDIEEELHSPILSFEVIEGVENWFIIINENNAYKYVLKYDIIKGKGN